jgi:starch synthase
MHVLHASFECYPYAKVGGMADIVGALPKYLNRLGVEASVVMPRYRRDWDALGLEPIFSGSFHLDWEYIAFTVHQSTAPDLAFTVFAIEIPGKFDRPDVYGYQDEIGRSVSFQRALLIWLRDGDFHADVVHCHDHHVGFVPFMMKYCYEFMSLSTIPTVFTVHNGAYQGAFSWEMSKMFPAYPPEAGGLMEWGGAMNALASAIKCCWKYTTVSEGYLYELMQEGHGLGTLFSTEWSKAVGILNGIDTEVWDPKKDPMIEVRLRGKQIDVFKAKNKTAYCEAVGIESEYPMFVFIGRFAYEKGADLLPSFAGEFLNQYHDVSFVFLGNGDAQTENHLRMLENYYGDRVRAHIMYSEKLAHQLYAACDYLIMPSRVEPCGLNQMYTMRYGGIPVVHGIGGLRDTVQPLTDESGNGYVFHELSAHAVVPLLAAARNLYQHKDVLSEVRKRNLAMDFSWDLSGKRYIDAYNAVMD